MILSTILLFIFLGVFGATMRSGLWTNTIRLINFFLAAFLAASMGEYVGGFLRGFMESYGFFTNFLGIWIVFDLTYLILREITTKISRVNVKFHLAINQYAGYFVALLLAYFFVGFSLYTVHQAPLSKNCIRGEFSPDGAMFFGMSPDKQFHAIFKYVANGAYASGNEFDPNDRYFSNYAKGRQALQEHVEATSTPRINSGQFK
ncbi:MAG: CvpA family protein [Planctomycetia bacterium]|nr:CvpA family protein [Planctomycetia bacterium]